jgi:hypothetical protein
MTSESTRFLGQPRETKPTRGPREAFFAFWGGTVGEDLGTLLFYVGGGRQRTENREQRTENREQRTDSERLAVFAIEEIAHGAAASGVDFERGAAFDVVGRGMGLGNSRFFWLAAGGAAVGEAGLAGAEFEILVADDAGFNWEGHWQIY